ncbi:hypothetical protein BJ165DRAFT_1528622 [Panaeolus papilionaceus]|nr:hypothetical protein BJ165DRAFT_1528622 [Panaeolus papilionaceus]
MSMAHIKPVIFADHAAWLMTRSTFITRLDEPLPVGHLHTRSVSLPGSYLCNRMVPHGQTMIVCLEEGEQTWFICAPSRDRGLSHMRQSVVELNPPSESDWDVHALKLTSGMGIMLKPGTYYATWTVRPSVLNASYGYMTNTLTEALAAQAHQLCYCSASAYAEVNSNAPTTLMHRLILFYHAAYVQKTVTPPACMGLVQPATIGAWNMLSLIVMGLCSVFFNPRAYIRSMSQLGNAFCNEIFSRLSPEELDSYAYIRGISLELLNFVMNNFTVAQMGSVIDRNGIFETIGSWLSQLYSICSGGDGTSNSCVESSMFHHLVNDLFSTGPTSAIRTSFLKKFEDCANDGTPLVPFDKSWTFSDSITNQYAYLGRDEDILDAGRSALERKLCGLDAET